MASTLRWCPSHGAFEMLCSAGLLFFGSTQPGSAWLGLFISPLVPLAPYELHGAALWSIVRQRAYGICSLLQQAELQRAHTLRLGSLQRRLRLPTCACLVSKTCTLRFPMVH